MAAPVFDRYLGRAIQEGRRKKAESGAAHKGHDSAEILFDVRGTGVPGPYAPPAQTPDILMGGGSPALPGPYAPPAVPQAQDSYADVRAQLSQPRSPVLPDFSKANAYGQQAADLARNPTPLPVIPQADMNDVEGLVTLIAGFYGQGAQMGSAAWDSARQRAQVTAQRIVAEYQQQEQAREAEIRTRLGQAQLSSDEAEAYAQAQNLAGENADQNMRAVLASEDRRLFEQGRDKLARRNSLTDRWNTFVAENSERQVPLTAREWEYARDAFMSSADEDLEFSPEDFPVAGLDRPTAAASGADTRRIQSTADIALKAKRLTFDQAKFVKEFGEKVRRNGATETETKRYHDILDKLGISRIAVAQQNAHTSIFNAATWRYNAEKSAGGPGSKPPSHSEYDKADTAVRSAKADAEGKNAAMLATVNAKVQALKAADPALTPAQIKAALAEDKDVISAVGATEAAVARLNSRAADRAAAKRRYDAEKSAWEKANAPKAPSGRDIPHVQAAKSEIERTFGIQGVGGYRAHNVIDKEGHPAGRALDVPSPVGGSVGTQVANWALQNKERLGVQYVIWNEMINSGSGWRPYRDRKGDRYKGVTAQHRDHVHVNFHPESKPPTVASKSRGGPLAAAKPPAGKPSTGRTAVKPVGATKTATGGRKTSRGVPIRIG